MKIQILGTGCPKCKKLYEMTNDAVKELNITADISKVENIKEIIALGAMTTPALAVDGKVVFSGSVPTPEKLRELLKQ